jgi:hypothetical protein
MPSQQPVNHTGDGWQNMGLPMNTPLETDEPNDNGEQNNAIDVDEEEEDDDESVDKITGRLSYQSVKANCEEMCRYVQNDQLQLAELKLLTDRILIRLRNKQNIHASFTDSMDSHLGTRGNTSMLPKNAVGRIVTNPLFMKRKRSRFEYGRKQKATRTQPSIAATTPSVFQTSYENHLPPPKLDHRACSFCKKAHHFVGKCPTLLQHGVPPLAPKDTKSRTKLQAELTAVGGIVTYTRDVEDKRTLYTTLPRGIGAIFIFKRLYVKDIIEKEHHDNFCVECTIYKMGGEEHELYSRSLFLVSCIATYVVRSSTNHIISLLQYTNLAPPLSQRSVSVSTPMDSFMNPGVNNFQTNGVGASQLSQESNNFLYSQLSQQLSQQILQGGHQAGFGYDFTNQSLPF